MVNEYNIDIYTSNNINDTMWMTAAHNNIIQWWSGMYDLVVIPWRYLDPYSAGIDFSSTQWFPISWTFWLIDGRWQLKGGIPGGQALPAVLWLDRKHKIVAQHWSNAVPLCVALDNHGAATMCCGKSAVILFMPG